MDTLLSLWESIALPAAYREFLIKADQALEKAGGAPAVEAAIDAFLGDETTKLASVVAPLDDYAARLSLPPRSLHALVVARCLLRLYPTYCERYGEEVFLGTARDLRCKIEECHTHYDTIGISTPFWYDAILRMTLFGLGRLQFHIIPFPLPDYRKGDICIEQGSPVVNVHIPSLGPLRSEDVHDAYRRAYRFFKDSARNGVLPIVCHSWLLYEKNREFMKPGSNILAFAADYEILANTPDPKNQNVWRIFGKDYSDYTLLPRENSLQAGLADYLLRGGTLGIGHGVLLFDGERIV